MLRGLRVFTICVFAIGLITAFYFIPSDQASSGSGDSPLYAVSLHKTTNQLSGDESSDRSTNGQAGVEGVCATVEVTCGPTCNQSTCGTTCLQTCQTTCANTCEQVTCQSTCMATCGATCAVTCAQPTCESTCVITCSYTCEDPITLITFTAEAGVGEVIVRWATGSEIENYCFTIWRSTNPQGEFNAIASIPSSRTPSVTSYYSYPDRDVEGSTTYYYKLSDVSLYGTETLHPMIASAMPGSGIAVTNEHRLVRNYPNPFNALTLINFQLTAASWTELTVYNAQGRAVRKLVDGNLSEGLHQVPFDGTDEVGNILPSGVYIYRLAAGELNTSGKMIFIK